MFSCRGADLSALVREAALAALKFHMPSSPVDGSVAVLNRKEEFDVTGCMVTDECFSTAFARVKKSVSERVRCSHCMSVAEGWDLLPCTVYLYTIR